jgi:hypothetical protein
LHLLLHMGGITWVSLEMRKYGGRAGRRAIVLEMEY